MTGLHKHLPGLVVLLGLGGACTPELGAPASLVSGRRILAVRGEPAEVRPGDSARFTALVVTPAGTVAAPAVEWGFCLTPKPLSENNAVAGACLGDGTVPILEGPLVDAALPANGCALFGPDAPPSPPGQPPLRPRDPDITGGYYQPMRALLPGAGSEPSVVSFGLERIRCNLAGAPLEVVQEYQRSYTANVNPALLDTRGQVIAAGSSGALLPLVPEGSTPGANQLDSVPRGAEVLLRARWSDTSAEQFPVYDPQARTLAMQREALRVSWFVSGGQLAQDRSGRGSEESETSADNRWTAPDTPGDVHLWVVLRDSRGGVSFAGYTAAVQ